MEDLQSLMTCLDDISNKIGDGMYLDMADKLKRVHDHMNGNKPIHEDTFYYSDTESDTESDSDYEPPTEAQRLQGREREFQKIRDEILECVKQMHEEYKVLVKLEKEARRTWTPIKRMTAFRKSQAIKQWCEKNTHWAPGGEAGELVGYLSTAAVNGPTSGWTWKNLMENGLRTIVLEIGTDEEKFADFVCYDELSLETLQKLPAFEKKIYDDYKEECNRLRSIDDTFIENASANVRKHEELMQKWEMAAREQENKLRELDAPVFARDNWDAENHNFWTSDEGQMVSSGWEARVELRR